VRVLRKDYIPLTDESLDKLKALSLPLKRAALASMTIPADTLLRLVMEVIDSREEIFRLQLCETVDQILSEELDMLDEDEEDHLAFSWPDDYCIGDDAVSPIFKPAFPCKETHRLPPANAVAITEHKGRRLPVTD
jgi:hypothetical protein